MNDKTMFSLTGFVCTLLTIFSLYGLYCGMKYRYSIEMRKLDLEQQAIDKWDGKGSLPIRFTKTEREQK